MTEPTTAAKIATTEHPLTASRTSRLLTLLRDDRPWEEKREEVSTFDSSRSTAPRG